MAGKNLNYYVVFKTNNRTCKKAVNCQVQQQNRKKLIKFCYMNPLE